MLRKITVSSAVFIFALGILITSVLRTAAVRYETSGVKSPCVLSDTDYNIDYGLAYPGKILPDSFLWPLKAVRDKLWLFITTDDLKKIDLKILFADKRIGGAVTLFEKGKNEIALSTLTKAEKYLEEASLAEEELRLEGNIHSNEVCLRAAARKFFSQSSKNAPLIRGKRTARTPVPQSARFPLGRQPEQYSADQEKEKFAK